MGLSSGGMTGITSRTIHSGLLSELRKDSQISMRFRRRLSDLGPFSIILHAELRRELVHVDLLEEGPDGLGAHARR